MTKVAVGRISPQLAIQEDWRTYLETDVISDSEFYFGADTLVMPPHTVFGVAYSYHPYQHYPLAQRDVQLAFDTIRASAGTQRQEVETDSKSLRRWLLTVSQAFAELNDSAEDYHTAPWVRIALVRVQRCHLSAAVVGDVHLYVVHPDGCKQVTAGRRKNATRVSPRLVAGLDPSVIALHEIEVKTADPIVVATASMDEVIIGADLDTFIKSRSCDPEVISRHLIDTLKSQPGRGSDPLGSGRLGRSTDYYIRTWGAAWAIACVESHS